MSLKFFKCKHCGQIIAVVKETMVPIICCGEKMEEIIPGVSDGAFEKHVPVVSIDGDTVTVRVGEIDHPMVDVHYIEWIALETKTGNQRKKLNPSDHPQAVFKMVEGDEVVCAYAYCNLHGLYVSK